MQSPPPFRRTGGIGMDAATKAARRTSIGGSDARIIMSGDLNAITNLWLEKRGENVDEDLSEVLFIQLGNITESFNLDWFEFESGLWVEAEQEKRFHPDYPWAHATLDGAVRRIGHDDHSKGELMQAAIAQLDELTLKQQGVPEAFSQPHAAYPKNWSGFRDYGSDIANLVVAAAWLHQEIARKLRAGEDETRTPRDHKANPANPRQSRVISWLIDKGWMETHPDAFLSQVRITDLGYDVLAQAGGDVTGTGW